MVKDSIAWVKVVLTGEYPDFPWAAMLGSKLGEVHIQYCRSQPEAWRWLAKHRKMLRRYW